jgi:hypothetical protein
MKKFSLLTSVGALAAAAFALSSTTIAQSQPAIEPASSGGYPVDAAAGQCFARVLVPEVADIATETVEDQPARTEIRAIPAKWDWVEETIVVKEASVEYQVVPATYRTVTETVEIEPARTETVAVPESTETYTDRVLVRPAYTTWKPGAGIFGRSSVASASGAAGAETHTGELLCRVEVPAEYANVTRTRVVSAASMSPRVIPAKTATVTRQVIATPARVVERPIPAETRNVRIRKMVEPAREERIVIPATTRTVERRVVRRAAGVEWREVLCETNASARMIADVQRGLTAAGYTVPSTGTFGPQTLAAMERFQRDRGLAVGYLTMETVRALGVTPR